LHIVQDKISECASWVGGFERLALGEKPNYRVFGDFGQSKPSSLIALMHPEHQIGFGQGKLDMVLGQQFGEVDCIMPCIVDEAICAAENTLTPSITNTAVQPTGGPV